MIMEEEAEEGSIRMNREQYINDILSAAYELVDEGNYDMDDIQNAVTGNYDGSYYCNSYKAKMAILDMLGTDVAECVDEWSNGRFAKSIVSGDFETADVLMRFYLFDMFCCDNVYKYIKEKRYEEE